MIAMDSLLPLLKMVPVVVAAILLGNWFLKEVKQAKLAKKPWYTPYLTFPGIIIIIIILLPVLLRVFGG